MKMVTLIPGDGIGPEISKSVVDLFAAAKIPITWDTVECGLAAFEKTGSLVSPKLETSLNATHVGLKGPTTTPVGGGHRSINVLMRQQYQLYANVRPVKSIPGMETKFSNVDLIIVRENTEDLYSGKEHMVDANTAHGIKEITRGASERIGLYAFNLARQLGRKKVTIVHKANIMKLTDGLFLKSILDLAPQFPDIQCNDVIIDNCCMQLVRRPEQFDVIVTENLYGDILSDLASGLIGGLGVASGSNIGNDKAIFEAVHGSAPDIAGQDLANPTALILSAISMLEHLNLAADAKRIRHAVDKTLGKTETRTRDLGGPLGTAAFTKALIQNL